MRKLRKVVLILFLFLFSGLTLFFQGSRKLSDKSPISSSQIDDDNDYMFIWDEFKNASADIKGDDSLVFGPSLGNYHNYTEIKYKINNLEINFPEMIEVFSIGTTYLGHDIYAVRITNEEINTKKKEILIVAQHHAREQITVENALYFIDKIINDTINQDENIINLLNEKEIFVIPSLNIDGSLLISSFPWQRKTVSGLNLNGGELIDKLSLTIPEIEPKDIDGDGYISVFYSDNDNKYAINSGYEGEDLNDNEIIGEDVFGGTDPNRNYDHDFGNPSYSTSLPESQIYHGEKPFSEKCTKNLKNFIEDHSFETVVSLHSGIQAIYYPQVYEFNQKYKEEFDVKNYENITSSLANILGFSSSIILFEAGMFSPWMYWENRDNRIAICLETYGNNSALKITHDLSTGLYEQWGIWDFFNPPANKVIENSELIFKGLLHLAEHTNPELKKIPGYEPFHFIMFFVGSIYIISKKKK
ncbi:M14 family zinc carboxypeptidase [Promethearchaeum syntrophicum]|uniref:M14 family zinc carboxypeptidase n=1 Tax=Promethearchaeum syntrophicum TaxID=2594042 RepID=A0A5B9D5Y6_9ARCH|nr:zinc carboxypeptidase [Candidatus Prometheoarchaeum syntrophicum]QEE14393.1 Zinc carboxypeptidase [Candidatus Prometheoarchaeum syntrophicum]